MAQEKGRYYFAIDNVSLFAGVLLANLFRTAVVAFSVQQREREREGEENGE